MLTLTKRADTWGRSILISAIGIFGFVFNCDYLYIQIAMVSVLLGGGQPKVRCFSRKSSVIVRLHCLGLASALRLYQQSIHLMPLLEHVLALNHAPYVCQLV